MHIAHYYIMYITYKFVYMSSWLDTREVCNAREMVFLVILSFNSIAWKRIGVNLSLASIYLLSLFCNSLNFTYAVRKNLNFLVNFFNSDGDIWFLLISQLFFIFWPNPFYLLAKRFYLFAKKKLQFYWRKTRDFL